MSKIVLITGSTDGIGKQTAFELANFGYQIIIHGKDETRVRNVVDEVKNKTGNTNIDFVIADFSQFEPIRKMAEDLISKYDKIDVLINNAGVFLNQRKTNSSGIELTFMINHLAHFYLTYLIFDLLKNSRDGRIINVSSVAHESADFDEDDFMLVKNYSGYTAYANSKLYNLWFTYKLHRSLNNSKVKVYALHPGVISTKLLYAGFKMTGSPLSIGAETPVYLASSDEVINLSGKYFIKKKPSKSSKLSYDEKLQDKLWDYSIELLGLDKDKINDKIKSL